MKYLFLLGILIFTQINVEAQSWTHTDNTKGINISYNYDLKISGEDTSLDATLKITDLIKSVTYDAGKLPLNMSNVLDTTKLANLLSSIFQTVASSKGLAS